MAFSEFTLESALGTLGLSVRESELFPQLTPAIVPDWLSGWRSRGGKF